MKGNIMMRLIALMILIPAILAHFTGQIDLTQPTWLWLTLFAGLNALQSTFTGWCPATKFFGKDEKTGQCCAADTSGNCCEPMPDTQTTDSAFHNAASAITACANSADCLNIKVLGSGCQNCATTLALIETTSAEMDIKICTSKVEDLAEIAHFGVMATPGVVINGMVVHSGSVPSKAQVTEWLSRG